MQRTEGTSRPGDSEPLQRLLRLAAVLQTNVLARSTVCRLMAEHAFPAPVKLAKRAVAWRQEDVRQWTNALPRPSR